MVKRPRLKWFILLLLFGIAAAGSWWWQSNVKQGRYKDIFSAFYVMGVVKMHYYQPASLSKLLQVYWAKGNIGETLKSLGDPYTRFLGKEEYAELRKDTKGTFGGIGIYLIPKEDELLISSVVAGSPGDEAGLQQGDRITAVEKSLVKTLSTEGAIAKIRGEAGTKVLLSIVRGEGQNRRELELAITRANISIPTVELQIKKDSVLGEYAYLKISQFAETTPVDLEKELSEITKSQARALILDLRANPGGSLDAAIKVAGAFLPDNTPILHVLRKGYAPQTLKVESKESYFQEPMVVLVDSWSASASEIVAGALKDQQRAHLIGTHTFGKDLIQEVKDLPGDTGVTITIASYLTSGRVNIHQKGVLPHEVVEIPGAMDQLLEKGEPDSFWKMQELQEQEAVKYLREQMGSRYKLAG